MWGFRSICALKLMMGVCVFTLEANHNLYLQLNPVLWIATTAASVALWTGRCGSMWWVQHAVVWLALGAAFTAALNFLLMSRAPPPASRSSHQQSPSFPALKHPSLHQQVYLKGEVYALRNRWVAVVCIPFNSLAFLQYNGFQTFFKLCFKKSTLSSDIMLSAATLPQYSILEFLENWSFTELTFNLSSIFATWRMLPRRYNHLPDWLVVPG